ncbi:MAG: hypothetical protein ABI615_03775 [Chthoniobacterales bacterium]
MIRHLLLFLFLGIGASRSIGAPLEFNIPVSKTPVPSLVQIALPGTRCAAVSDSQSLLAIGHHASNGMHISIYTLDATGTPSVAPAAQVALPTSPALQKSENYPISVAFHPTLPLLYVWQDINAPEMPAAQDDKNPVYKEFDHLLIYAVKGGGSLQLVQSLARGPGFAYKQTLGKLEVDPINQRLFLPNLRVPKALMDATASVGYYSLDVQGMPARTASQPTPTPKVLTPLVAYPVGLGFAGASKDAVIVGAQDGPIVWEFDNRRVNASKIYFHNAAGLWVSGHPKLPLVYMAGNNTPKVFCMEHVDGFLTLLPQRVTVDGASFQSAPVVMTKQNRIAVGGINFVYTFKLDATGRLTTEMEQSPLSQARVSALAYSEKLDRLYVGVDLLK